MARGKAGGVTPIRRQYLELKRQVPDAILFFRLGDFYETFDEDAELVSRELDIVLTSRNVAKNVRVPMAGIPYHALESYLARLIEKGYKVAIAEQIGEPTGRGPMTRKIVRIVTPGTVVEPELLPGDANNYLAAVVTEGRKAGIAYADISTGEFAATELEGPDLPDLVRAELLRLKPAEILHPEDQTLPEGVPGHPSPWPAWHFEFGRAQDGLKEHFQVARLEGFGLGGKPLAVRAAGAILQYLQETRPEALALLTGLRTYSLQDFMALDATTRRALELTETIRDGSVRGSLLWVLDRTVTPMGRRLLRQWIHRPLVDPERIRRRLDGVEFFVQHPILRAQMREALKPLADLERLTNRVVAGSAQPRDLVSLRATLRQIPALVELFKGGGQWAVGSLRSAVGGQQSAHSAQPNDDRRPTTDENDQRPSTIDHQRPTNPPTNDDRRPTNDALSLLLRRLDPVSEALELLERAIAEEPPATLQHTGVIRRGFSPELDRIYEESEHAREWIASLEERERRRTGIKNLKVGYNKVFGYYIEVTKANLHLVPKDYIRKQTLVNAERFITPEMKEYEALVLHAEERIKDLEARLYKEVLDKLAGYRERLLGTARALAVLDVLAGLAEVAVENDYVRPEIVEDDRVLEIREGRHPVVEKTQETPFVPNDTVFEEGERIRIITGPNMGGKCVAGDTWVFTEQGLRQIRDLQPRHAVEPGFTPLGLRVRGKDGPRTATHFYTGGRQPTLRVTTRFGFTLEGTPEHRVWVRFPDGREGWKRLGELQPGDVVALAQGMDFWGNRVDLNTPRARNLRGVKRYRLPDKMSEDLAYLLGLLVGDGTLTYTHAVTFTMGDEELGQAFRDIVRKLFGYEAKRKANGKDWYISSRQIRVFLEELGLGYVQAHEKTVPEAILRAPRAMVVAFLQGLFDTDGHVSARHGRVSLSTTSPTLARQVQLLLLNLGIVASLRPKPTTHRLSYRLQIYGEHAARFHRVVGFRLSRKRERARPVPRERHPNTGVPHTQGLLRTVHQRLVQAPTRTVAIKRDPVVEALLYTYLPKGHAPSYAKLEALLRFCQANGVAVPELEGLLARRYLYDVVRTIEPSEADVFDLSVEEEHAYIANGFISHNSTYLRQTALIVLMAQMGSFVPAREARIGLVDRIFTRIGAQDEIHMGQSTFMVEMMETAHILHHATRRSLVILDEIGRGTSTYDGMAIAWAVVEYLHNHPNLRCRTLFATHYHELTRLADLLPGVRNYHVSVTEHEGQVVFLYKVLPGGADRSYGIHVAQLAGLPRSVVARAQEILEELEREGGQPESRGPAFQTPIQLALFPETHPLLEELHRLDPDNMTPLEALTLLYKWKQTFGDAGGRK